MCSTKYSDAPMMRISSVAKGHKIGPARTLSSLTLPQVRMILRIYWTDRYTRRARGKLGTTLGLRIRLAQQFDVSVEVVKKVISIKHNQYGWPRRNRFKTVSLLSIQRTVKRRLQQRGIPIASRPRGRPRKRKPGGVAVSRN